MKIEKKTIENDLKFLRQISKPVDFYDETWKEAIKELDLYCKQDPEIYAMASVQLGIPLRLVYLKRTDLARLEEEGYNEAKVLINPVIIKQEGCTRYWEACASCLDYMGLVERPYQIEIEYYDPNKQKHKEVFSGFSATVLSHELDHLDGILHMYRAIEVLKMPQEERKKFRKMHPYEILSKTRTYPTPKINKKVLF